MSFTYRKIKNCIVYFLVATMVSVCLSGCTINLSGRGATPEMDDANVTTDIVGDSAGDEVTVIITQIADSDCWELGSEYNFNVADFFTAEGIEPDELTVDLSGVNSDKCGTYDVLVSYKDIFDSTVSVTVIDTIPPEMFFNRKILYVNDTSKENLLNEYNINYKDFQDCEIKFSDYYKFAEYSIFEELSEFKGVDLLDEIENRVIDTVFTYSDEVTELEEGIYAVEMQVVDGSGNTASALGVFVYDCTPATISGLKDQTVYQNDLDAIPSYSVSSVKIEDNLDGKIDIEEAEVTFDVKDASAHTYTLTVSYTDKAGNVSTKEAVITVKKPAAAPSNPAPSNPGSSPSDPGTGTAPSDPAPSDPAPAPVGSSDYLQRVLELVNEQRAANGLAPLTLNSELCSNAAVRAAEIVGVFDHTRPDGSSCFTAITVPYMAAGENIAAGYPSPEAVVEGWMNSPGHRANILSNSYTELGVGYYYDAGSPYKYYWVQLFVG